MALLRERRTDKPSCSLKVCLNAGIMLKKGKGPSLRGEAARGCSCVRLG